RGCGPHVYPFNGVRFENWAAGPCAPNAEAHGNVRFPLGAGGQRKNRPRRVLHWSATAGRESLSNTQYPLLDFWHTARATFRRDAYLSQCRRSRRLSTNPLRPSRPAHAELRRPLDRRCPVATRRSRHQRRCSLPILTVNPPVSVQKESTLTADSTRGIRARSAPR